ncbi:MAG: hypothetical protein KJO05_11920 [Bacteroidia bacterium]|nr:hypothetical protein [Bacteroidia bacterium]NNF31821.1 hypothetical protein [Flavobacteriaceae bacterium]MBT8276250.1 hypothetical protein [Bacteroidia bacterium]NNJ81188.1 hypothetical protein [Flavobacteriaceae bacterium]NNK53340.1 hypothetical protein [Flavobacteriaceae bacterium]
MKIEHLEERITDYKASIETVVEKKTLWKSVLKGLIKDTFDTIVARYDIGWKVQELSWIYTNEAVNISFDSFPPELIDCTNRVPAYQFIRGGSLVFSQTYNGDIFVFILFPYIESKPGEGDMQELGTFNPGEITEKFIVEKVDEFLKAMIRWELPNKKNKVGFS